MRLKLTCSDGTAKEITSRFTCTPTKLSNIGKQKIVVSPGGRFTGFYVTAK